MPLSNFVSQKVVVEVYKIIAHVYVTQLVKIRPKKLTKSWSPELDVCQKIKIDAVNLHTTITEMVRATVLMPLTSISSSR